MSNEPPINPRPFPATQWSLVARADQTGEDQRREALGQLLKQYLPALKTHLVLSKKIDPDRADDLLQGFVADKVMGQRLLAQVDRDRGRFRTFLLGVLRYYVAAVHRREAAENQMPSADAMREDRDWEPRDLGQEPSAVFDLAWAQQVLRRTLDQMKRECHACGRSFVWGVFESRVVAPTLDRTEAVPYATLVERYGFESPVQAANAMVTAKRMFARTLRAVVGEYAGDEPTVAHEVRELREILAQARP